MNYIDHLSAAILRFCQARGLSYEAAADRCRLSARYFGSVARGQATPSVATLEKLCGGLSMTLNELLLPERGASPCQNCPLLRTEFREPD